MKHFHGSRATGHRYPAFCTNCGWGLTTGQLANANFCPRCGTDVPQSLKSAHRNPDFCRTYGKNSRPHFEVVQEKKAGWTQEKPRSCTKNGSTGEPWKRSNRRSSQLSAKPELPLIGKVTRMLPAEPPAQALVEFTRKHPMAVGAGAAVIGAGLVCAAPAMVVAGAAVTAMGASISSGGAVVGCLVGLASVAGKCPGGILVGASIAGGALVLGGTVAFAGGLVLASGGVMAVAGTGLAYAGGTLALGAGARQLYLWEKENGHLGRGTTNLRDRIKSIWPREKSGVAGGSSQMALPVPPPAEPVTSSQTQ